jgi:broad specificity phosphatase PhoE
MASVRSVTMPRIVLIRHGESNATVQRFIGGHRTCTGLSDLGFRQAVALSRRLAETGEPAATRLISSNFLRARQTAEAIAGPLGLAIEEIPEFGEHDPGPEVDGMPYEVYTERFPDRRPWDENPYASGFVGGESIARFQLRIGEALSSLVDSLEPEEVAVVACHGGVIDSAFRQLMALPLVGVFELHTMNTSITEFESTKRADRWKLVRYNDIAHLAGLPPRTEPPEAA